MSNKAQTPAQCDRELYLALKWDAEQSRNKTVQKPASYRNCLAWLANLKNKAKRKAKEGSNGDT